MSKQLSIEGQKEERLADLKDMILLRNGLKDMLDLIEQYKNLVGSSVDDNERIRKARKALAGVS